MVDFAETGDQEIRFGHSGELNLRASVATLIKVLFNDPVDGNKMLALERTATLRETQGKTDVTVRAKPFGGAVRLIDPQELVRLIGDFNYDSEQSRRERDLRIQIKPEAWEKLVEICCEHIRGPKRGILDSSPEREIAEEFEDTLHVRITRDQYQIKPRGIIVEGVPEKTDSVRAAGQPTVRVYYLFDAWIESPALITLMLANSNRYTDADLQKKVLHDAQQGGRGRANAMLILRWDDLLAAYRSLPVDMRNGSFFYEGHWLSGNTQAILDEVEQTRYQRIIT